MRSKVCWAQPGMQDQGEEKQSVKSRVWSCSLDHLQASHFQAPEGHFLFLKALMGIKSVLHHKPRTALGMQITGNLLSDSMTKVITSKLNQDEGKGVYLAC